MAGRRSSVAGLERALRALQPGSRNLGHYLAEHGNEFAALLDVGENELRALYSQPDEEAAPRIRELLQRRTEMRTAHHQAARRDAAMGAAQRLAATAVWRANTTAVLDVTILFGDLLADPDTRHINLVSRAFEVHLPRKTLVDAAHVLPRQFADLVSWVDPAGLHFRWRYGRGGLDFYPQVVPASEWAHVLCVNIPAPAVEQARPTPVTRERRRHVARPGLANRPNPARSNMGWLAEALTEIAFSA
jgi:hypothetical protein